MAKTFRFANGLGNNFGSDTQPHTPITLSIQQGTCILATAGHTHNATDLVIGLRRGLRAASNKSGKLSGVSGGVAALLRLPWI